MKCELKRDLWVILCIGTWFNLFHSLSVLSALLHISHRTASLNTVTLAASRRTLTCSGIEKFFDLLALSFLWRPNLYKLVLLQLNICWRYLSWHVNHETYRGVVVTAWCLIAHNETSFLIDKQEAYTTLQLLSFLCSVAHIWYRCSICPCVVWDNGDPQKLRRINQLVHFLFGLSKNETFDLVSPWSTVYIR